MSRAIDPATLKRWLADGEELAIVDVREEEPFSRAHLFYAAPLPLSRLELAAPAQVPRRNARIVLVDQDGGDLAHRAADVLAALGYGDVSLLAGGNAAWAAAGFELFSGVHVPSKAFGEFIEHHYETPRMPAEELQRRIAQGEDLIVLDSRPMDEYHAMNIPGGIDCPGVELAYRLPDLAPSRDTLVVVNCAGRTRSIIGAQSLINANYGHRVTALKDGTMGWHLAGLSLEHGQTRSYGPVSEAGLARAQGAIADLRARFDVPEIDHATLAAWRAEAERRSLYLLDVRGREEFEAGHLPGSRHAPGGQLVQETESWVASLGARIVLIDDTGVRAGMTAHWLVQMGWEVAVLREALAGQDLESGPEAEVPLPAAAAAVATVEAADLKGLLADGAATLIDLAPARDYDSGHIAGAAYAIRARLGELPAPASQVTFTSPDGRLARLAASDRGGRALAGGTAAWRAAGLPLEDGPGTKLSAPEDSWLKPYDHAGDVEQRMRDYLTWEVGLVDAIERDGDHRFRLFPAP